MKLIIDAGNTAVKLAIFKHSSLHQKMTCELTHIYLEIETILNKFPKIESIIISAVSVLDIEKIKLTTKHCYLIILNQTTPLPFINNYKTPSTLGVDRIALMAAAALKFPKKNCLVIDAGTCITFDFINTGKEYYGGIISLGLQMRYKSLNKFTAKLPLLNPKNIDFIVGDSSENAIHKGATSGLITEIEGVISQFSNTYPNLIVVLTGGDANFLSKQLKSSIFVLPNFLMEGLCHILDYNLNK